MNNVKIYTYIFIHYCFNQAFSSTPAAHTSASESAFWPILCTLKDFIYLLTYLLTYLKYNCKYIIVFSSRQQCVGILGSYTVTKNDIITIIIINQFLSQQRLSKLMVI